jgi:hypothetical protein
MLSLSSDQLSWVDRERKSMDDIKFVVQLITKFYDECYLLFVRITNFLDDDIRNLFQSTEGFAYVYSYYKKMYPQCKININFKFFNFKKYTYINAPLFSGYRDIWYHGNICECLCPYKCKCMCKYYQKCKCENPCTHNWWNRNHRCIRIEDLSCMSIICTFVINDKKKSILAQKEKREIFPIIENKLAENYLIQKSNTHQNDINDYDYDYDYDYDDYLEDVENYYFHNKQQKGKNAKFMIDDKYGQKSKKRDIERKKNRQDKKLQLKGNSCSCSNVLLSTENLLRNDEGPEFCRNCGKFQFE